MLTDETRLRVRRQVEAITADHRQGKGGFKVKAIALPAFDTQEDHDRYRPDDAATVDFRDHNEYVAEVLKGLRANNIPAELVIINGSQYTRWLNGRENTSTARAAFCAMLISEEHQENSS